MHHGNNEDIIWPETDLLTPTRIEQCLGVESDNTADQSSEGRVRCCLDAQECGAKERRQRVGAKRQPSDNAEAATAAALQRPEQLRIDAGVHGPEPAIGSDDLGLEQTGSR